MEGNGAKRNGEDRGGRRSGEGKGMTARAKSQHGSGLRPGRQVLQSEDAAGEGEGHAQGNRGVVAGQLVQEPHAAGGARSAGGTVLASPLTFPQLSYQRQSFSVGE
eukprot:260188-Hanusia_phi.AAC.5